MAGVLGMGRWGGGYLAEAKLKALSVFSRLGADTKTSKRTTVRHVSRRKRQSDSQISKFAVQNAKRLRRDSSYFLSFVFWIVKRFLDSHP
jgi:hypothetical protein